MKKLLVALIMLLGIMIVPTTADAKWEDSLTVDSETRQLLGIGDEDFVMRIYSRNDVMVNLRDGGSIDDVLNDSIGGDYISYVYKNEDFRERKDEDDVIGDSSISLGFTAKEIVDESVILSGRPRGHHCRVFYNLWKKTDQVMELIGKDVEAEAIYFLDYFQRDFIVYYVTNVGDYMLFSTSDGTVVGEPRNEYLVPFADIQRFARDYLDTHEGLVYGSSVDTTPSSRIPEGWLPYKVEIPEQNILRDVLLWSIPVVVILAAGGLWFFLRRRKKKEVSPA